MPTETRSAALRAAMAAFPPVPPGSTAAQTQTHLETYLTDNNYILLNDPNDPDQRMGTGRPARLQAYSSAGNALRLAAERTFFEVSIIPLHCVPVWVSLRNFP